MPAGVSVKQLQLVFQAARNPHAHKIRSENVTDRGYFARGSARGTLTRAGSGRAGNRRCAG